MKGIHNKFIHDCISERHFSHITETKYNLLFIYPQFKICFRTMKFSPTLSGRWNNLMNNFVVDKVFVCCIYSSKNKKKLLSFVYLKRYLFQWIKLYFSENIPKLKASFKFFLVKIKFNKWNPRMMYDKIYWLKWPLNKF